MASKAALKIQRDKEIAAMMYNSKEQRVLEKSLQTLRLEQTYALKLLELDHRIIKVRYKKLKENVSKIKSHLPVDDISNFRDLDLQGKLHTSGQSGVNLGSAIKIAAAARRLNLGAGLTKRSRARSALPKISVKEPSLDLRSKSVVSISDPPVVGRIKRCNSITGAFIDAVDDDEAAGGANKRPASASTPSHRHTSRPQTVSGAAGRNNLKINNGDEANQISNHSKKNSSSTNIDLKPQMDAASSTSLRPSSQNGSVNESNRDTPKTFPVNVFATVKETLSVPVPEDEGQGSDGDGDLDPMPTFRSISSIMHRPRSPFSSHAPAAREARGRMASAPARQHRRMSHISTDSIDSNLGESSHEERRQELLEEEGVRSATLDQRTKLFLKDVDEYLLRNPPLQPSHMAFENGIPEPPRRDSLIEPAASQLGADAHGNGRSVRFRQRRGEAKPGEEPDVTPTFFPEAQYKERLLGLWKDMNKCRYLRVPDEKIDLSGINTLAKDQMKLFETLRNSEKPSLRQAWET